MSRLIQPSRFGACTMFLGKVTAIPFAFVRCVVV
jgi:hypothetical protein